MTAWFDLVVAALASWRLCHLVAHEDGPFDLVLRLRRLAGGGVFGRLMDCPYCLSLWTAAPFAAFFAERWSEGIVLWLGISGAACLLERASETLAAKAEPPVIDLPATGRE